MTDIILWSGEKLAGKSQKLKAFNTVISNNSFFLYFMNT